MVTARDRFQIVDTLNLAQTITNESFARGYVKINRTLVTCNLKIFRKFNDLRNYSRGV